MNMLRTIVSQSASLLLPCERLSYCVRSSLYKSARCGSTLIGDSKSLHVNKNVGPVGSPDQDINDASNQIGYESEVINPQDVHTDQDGHYYQHVERGIPKSYEEFSDRRRLSIIQPEHPRLLKAAVIGMPNAGKSTLTNQLIGTRVSAVSSKVHTTRENVVGVYVEGDYQIEFFDTPGLVTPQHCMKFELEHSFMSGPKYSAQVADLIMVVVDASNLRERTKLNAGIINLLQKHEDKTSILILNKIDQMKAKQKLIDVTTRLSDGIVGGVKSIESLAPIRLSDKTLMQATLDKAERRARRKGHLLDLQPDVRKYGEVPEHDQEIEDTERNRNVIDVSIAYEEKIGWPRFSRVFMVSALDGDGVEDLRNYLLESSKPCKWRYHGSVVTPQSPQKMVINCVKEKVLENTRQEIPYLVKYHIESWVITAVGTICVSVNLIVPKNRFMTFLLGPEGLTIRTIAEEARQTLANTFECDVALKLIVKSSERKEKVEIFRKSMRRPPAVQQ